jgi:hypothetical protein
MKRFDYPKRIAVSVAILSFFALTVALVISCHKEDASGQKDLNTLKEKVSAWLDLQKPATQPNKAATVELLKTNLDFGKHWYEQLNTDERLLVIPVKNPFREAKKVAESSILNLILFITKAGAIRRSNLVLFVPDANNRIAKLPANTYRDIFNNRVLKCSGRFQFMSPSPG